MALPYRQRMEREIKRWRRLALARSTPIVASPTTSESTKANTASVFHENAGAWVNL